MRNLSILIRCPALAIFFVLAASQALAAEVPRSEEAFTEYMASRFRTEIPDTAVSIKGPLTIMVGQLQANLDRVYVFCQRNPNDCPGELDKYLKGLAARVRHQLL